ncbi:MAG: hypothetical protein M3Y41_07315 [Pseudomonadota bacterium]|nr:hypothetical protein [Pseudomonadota bacterium]
MSNAERAAGRAVVIGASMAGLLAARVLADHFADVLVLEKDTLPETATPRRGVAQGRHLHVLLSAGLEIIEAQFPGLVDDLTAAGALLARGGTYRNGGYVLPPSTSLRVVTATRPLIEAAVRRRLMQLGNVRLMTGAAVRQLRATPDNACVTGVCATGLEGPGVVAADLVVDTTGRGSRAARWMEELGYAPPADETIAIPVAYMTRIFRRRPSDLGDNTFEMVMSDRPCHRAGILIAVEGGRWLATLAGYGAEVPPQDLAGFIAYARSLPAARLGDLVAGAEPLDDGCPYRFPASLRRRWERLARLPEGFLVLGDGICSFNPVFGQGMTVAAQESRALAAALAGPRETLARRFYRDAARVVDRPWAIAAGGDLQHPDAVGRRGSMSGMVSGYLNRVTHAAHRDPVVATRLHQAMHLMIPPAGLFRPDIVARVLRDGASAAWLRRPQAARA